MMCSKKGWRHGSSGRSPAQQAPSPECKPQYYQKNVFFPNLVKKKILPLTGIFLDVCQIRSWKVLVSNVQEEIS
jgi:hypothetical protein